MANEKLNNFKLGVFIALGLGILIVTMYMVGKSQNLFGSSFHVRARVSDVNGLVVGNSVRYGGIQAGTVSDIQVLNDSIIEITLSIDRSMKPFIHANSRASIGSDGLIGNKVIDITSVSTPGPEIEEGGLLKTDRLSGTDQMMKTLSNTNNNIEILSEKLINTVDQINNSSALWQLLGDTTLPISVRTSLSKLGNAAGRIDNLSMVVNTMALDIQSGKGTVGLLLRDKKATENTRQAIEDISIASARSKQLLSDMQALVSEINKDVTQGPGSVHSLLKDTALVNRLNKSMIHIEKGTKAFSEDMEALKHNILLRGYFRRQERKNNK